MRHGSKQRVVVTAGTITDTEIRRPEIFGTHARVGAERQRGSLSDAPAFGPDFVTDLPPVFIESQGFVLGCSHRYRHGQRYGG